MMCLLLELHHNPLQNSIPYTELNCHTQRSVMLSVAFFIVMLSMFFIVWTSVVLPSVITLSVEVCCQQSTHVLVYGGSSE